MEHRTKKLILYYGLLIATIGIFCTLEIGMNNYKRSEKGLINSRYESQKDSLRNVYQEKYQMEIDSLEIEKQKALESIVKK